MGSGHQMNLIENVNLSVLMLFTQFGLQFDQRDFFVLDLRPLRLAFHRQSCRNMDNSHRTVGGVYVLATSATSSFRFDFQISILNL